MKNVIVVGKIGAVAMENTSQASASPSQRADVKYNPTTATTAPSTDAYTPTTERKISMLVPKVLEEKLDKSIEIQEGILEELRALRTHLEAGPVTINLPKGDIEQIRNELDRVIDGFEYQ